MGEIRVMLADPLPVVRAGCRALLGGDPCVSVVAEAVDGRGVTERASALRPDVTVLGDDMPDLAGVVAAIDPVGTGINLLILVGRPDPTLPGRLLRSGVRGLVPASADAGELLAAVRAVAAGDSHVPHSMTGHVMGALLDSQAAERSAGSMSGREEDVLRLLAAGYGTKEVAARLRVSPRTVETYKHRGMDKLGLQGRVDLVRYAVAHKWLEGESHPRSEPGPRGGGSGDPRARV